MNPFEIVKTVRLTEKSTRLSTVAPRLLNAAQRAKIADNKKHVPPPLNHYTLVVDRRANKIQIRDAVQQLFDVTVLRVNTMNVRGKARRQNTPAAGRDAHWKKAIVTLKAGDAIQLT